MRLSAAVTTVNDDIGTGSIGRGIGYQVNVSTLQLLGFTITTHGDHRFPQCLSFLVDEIGETGVNVTWGDGVDTGEIAPFVGEGASHVNTSCLCDVVGGLLLWEVGNVTGHRGGDDEGSGSTLLEVVTDSLCAVEGSVQIGLDDLVP